MKKLTIAVSLLISLGISAQKRTWNDKSKTVDQRVELLLKEMTLEEKVGQMNQYNGFWNVTGPAPKGGSAEKKYEDLRKGRVGSMLNVRGVKEVRAVQKIAVEQTRLGIPLIIGFDVIHGYKTISPIPLAEAASFDLEAIRKSAAVAADEAAAAGINWTFAPMVDISRDARWGRVMEGAGEDPFYGAKVAEARVKGFQGTDLSANNTIAACAKHFAGYGFAESGRDYNTVDIGNNTLYNVVLPPFKAASDAGARTFMNSFNILDGVPATGNKFLQRDILKGKWNFKGFIVSDWGSIGEMYSHGFAKDTIEAGLKAVIAGSDMDMESNAYIDGLAKMVNEGKVDISLVDDAVKRILKVKFELGLFDDPYRYCDEKREKTIGQKANHDAVFDMAKKSIVLLKNDSNLLPLKKSGQKIALIGALANDKDSPLGSWRIAAENNSAVSVLEGLKQYKGNELVYEKGADVAVGQTSFTSEVNINTKDKSGFEKAKAVAKAADVVVIVLGEIGYQSGEARSRTNIDLPGVQQELLEEIYKVNKNVVLVLNNGRPLALEWANANIPAIVEAWQLGSQAGNAVAQVLYGDYNPSGKLPMSFPRNVGQVPIYYNNYSTGRPDKTETVFWSHYSDSEKTPLFPFGYGLSYSKFEYSNLKLDKSSYKKGESVKVSVTLKNSGNFDGKEAVQLYIHDKVASVARPVKELKGFELAEIRKGETKTISFTLTEKELGFYDLQGNYTIEPGTFDVFVGTNSRDTLQAKFELQ